MRMRKMIEVACLILLLCVSLGGSLSIEYPTLERLRRSADIVKTPITMSHETVLSRKPAIPSNYEIRVGLLMPSGNVKNLVSQIGFGTSAGAILIALDRIRKEKLLPGAKWSFVWQYDECDEVLAARFGVEMLGNRRVDVILGPPCSNAAMTIGIMTKYYNIPMMSWAATESDLADPVRFPTMARTIGSADRMGRALKEMLSYFNWRRIAMMYTDDGQSRRCSSIAEGLRKTFSKTGLINALNHPIDRATVTDVEIERFLDALPTRARIVVLCIEHEFDVRRFMLRAREKGLTTREYVYILPDYVRDGNRTDLWINYESNTNADGRDQEAKEAFRSALFMEMQLASTQELHHFKKEVIRRAKEWPFNYKTDDPNEGYGSQYSPFLHDALYMYAMALNRTLESGGSLQDGARIVGNSRNLSFQGISGHVVIDEKANREPSFVIRTFDRAMRTVAIAEALMHNNDGDTINLLVPADSIWDGRGGHVPLDSPECGFHGERCRWAGSKYVHWIVIGAIFSMFLLAMLITCLVYKVKKHLIARELAKMLWKVEYKDLVWINNRQGGKSLGSLRTITTTASDQTAEAIAKGNTNVVRYKNTLSWARPHQISAIISTHDDHVQLKMMRDLAHENMNPFLGLCLDGPHPISLWKYCSKGSVEDLIHNENVKLDWFFKYSLIKDLATGMEYLSESPAKSHGRLRSSNCLVDNRWSLKITDYGLEKMRVPPSKREPKDKLWTAPELLRDLDPPLKGTCKGDVYSFAIILQELVTRDRPFCSESSRPEEIIERIAKLETPPFRPTVRASSASDSDIGPAIIQLMNDCWKEDPHLRPDFKQIKSVVRQINRGRSINLMDHVLKMMEKYASNLEETVTDRTRQLTEEMKKSDLLLYRLLPKLVADSLKAGKAVEPEMFESATILFSDVVSFSKIAARSSPLQTVNLLNDLYSLFDDIIGLYDVYKVVTIGDGCMCASGLPIRNGNRHPAEMADMALHVINSMRNFHIGHLAGELLQVRLGIHTGPCIAGVVGVTMPRYCVFGDTVNMANRLENTSKPSCIHISEHTNQYLTEVIGGYLTKARGEISVKGKGTLYTYWLQGKDPKVAPTITGVTQLHQSLLSVPKSQSQITVDSRGDEGYEFIENLE